MNFSFINLKILTFILAVLTSFSISANHNNKSESESVKEALAPKEGDQSREDKVKELFTKTKENYSLLSKRSTRSTVDFQYSYFASIQSTAVLVGDKFSMSDLRSDSDREFATIIGIDHGIADNLTIGLSLPSYLKNSESQTTTEANIGDTLFSLRWQPRPGVSGELTTLMYLNYSFASGQSPFEIELGEELSTGQGFSSVGFGFTFHKVFDPLVGFGSIGYTKNINVDGLEQSRYFFLDADVPIEDRTKEGVLTEVEPGDTISASVGLSYAINYGFNLTMQYQHSITDRTTFNWEYTSATSETIMESTESQIFDSGTIKFTAGWKGDDGSFRNLHVILPVTDGQPDIIIGFTLPLFFVAGG